MSSAFTADWLSLRESLDHQARSTELVGALAGQLRPDGPIIDLGAGHGSNLRYLAPRLGPARDWLLLDQDVKLLNEAGRNAPVQRVDTRAVNLTRLPQLDLPRPALVTASALIDLASADWLDSLARRVSEWKVPLMIALSVDGRRGFLLPDGQDQIEDTDDTCRRAFNHHQTGAKGLGWGPALGPDAVRALTRALQRHGFRVQSATADWRIPANSDLARTLGRALLEDWHQAVADTGRLPARELAEWLRMRRAALATGQLGLMVGHQDLLALPPG